MWFRQFHQGLVQFFLKLRQTGLPPRRFIGNKGDQIRVMFGVEIQVIETQVDAILALLKES